MPTFDMHLAHHHGRSETEDSMLDSKVVEITRGSAHRPAAAKRERDASQTPRLVLIQGSRADGEGPRGARRTRRLLPAEAA